jgi:hypothetical protein
MTDVATPALTLNACVADMTSGSGAATEARICNSVQFFLVYTMREQWKILNGAGNVFKTARHSRRLNAT